MSSNYHLSEKDLAVLRLAQKHFGFSARPYKFLADKLQMSEVEVIEILKNLKAEGIITRVGPFLNLDRSNGYVSLVAMIVPECQFDEVSSIVNDFQEVAHNYKRDHEFNMWFVLAAKSFDDANRVLLEIEKQTNMKTYNLPKLKEFNLDLYLEV